MGKKRRVNINSTNHGSPCTNPQKRMKHYEILDLGLKISGIDIYPPLFCKIYVFWSIQILKSGGFKTTNLKWETLNVDLEIKVSTYL